MAEKYADLRIRARDEFSQVLEKGKRSLDKFVESASRKDLLKSSIAQRQAVNDQRVALAKLQAQYASLAQQTRGSSFTRELAVESVNLRDKIYKTKDALQEQYAVLQKLRGSGSSFAAFSRGADTMRASASNAETSIKNLRDRVKELRVEQDAAAAKARNYLANQSQANKIGSGFGATNANLGRGFSEQVKTLKSDIAGLEASLHRMSGAAQGSFLTFSKKADALRETGDSARAATSAIGKLSEAEKRLASASRLTETAQQRAARTATELRAHQSDLIAKFGAESAEVRKLNAVLSALDERANRVAGSQKRMGAAAAGATGALGAQSGQGRRKARQNFGSQFVGEDQEVTAFGLRPYQLTNLGYQVNDVVSGVAQGQPIMQIFAQQIGQLVQIFPAFSRGMIGIFEVLEKFPLISGVAAAGVALVGTAFYRVRKEASDSREALAGAGNVLTAFADSANYSVSGIAQAALGMKELTGSIQDAVDLAKTFTRAGIRTDRFEDVTAVAAKLAAITGDKLPEAGQKLADAFSGGFDSLREFDKELNVFTASELETIRTMYAAGDAAGAQEYAFDALKSKLDETSTAAKGPWSRAFSSLGGVWSSLVDLLANSIVIQGLSTAFDALGDSVSGVADAAKYLLDSDILKVATGDFTPIFGEQEQSVQSLTNTVEVLKEAIADTQSGLESSSGLTRFFSSLTGGNALLRSMQEELRKAEFELEKLQGGADPGLTLQKVEELRKAYGDFSATLSETNKEREDETALIGLSKREVEIETSKREALNSALEAGLDKLPEWTRLWADETAAIEKSVNAKFDAIDAADKLKDAQELVTGAIEDARSEQEQSAAAISELEDALKTLAETTGTNTEEFKKGQEALAKLREEAENAETPFDKLGKKIPEVAKELKRIDELAEINKLEKEALAAAKSWEEVVAVMVRARQAREAVDLATQDASFYEKQFSTARFSNGNDGQNIASVGINKAQAAELVAATSKVAAELGISAKDLLTAISYETAGTFDPQKRGPTTQYGQHRGLIQFGEPQAQKYGFNQDSTISDQLESVKKYLIDTGVQKGDGLLQIYAAINAGNARKYNASDANNGGAPGTVADKVETMSGHAAKAEGLLAAYQGVSVASAEAAENEKKAAEERTKYNEAIDTSLSRQQFENTLTKLNKTDREIALALYDQELVAKEKGVVLSEAQKKNIAETVRLKNQERDAQDRVNEAEQRVNDLITQRQALEQQRTIAQEGGDQEKAAALKTEIEGLNAELLKAIENSQAMTASLGGPGADAAVAKMQTLKLETQQLGNQSAVSKTQIDQMLEGAASGAFSQFAQSLAQGKGLVQSLGEAFRKFASDTLIQIGQLIVRLTIMNALKNSGLGGSIAGGISSLVGVAHTGGVIGGGISMRRAVSPDLFAGVTRYHTGGIMGLKPNEVPIVAKVGEEMLTEKDPRHRNNGGGAGQPVTIVNAVDGSDALAQALASPRGTQLVINHMRANRDAFKAALG